MTTSHDQQFEAIYRDYSRQITVHVASRLYRADPQLAEDLTAETFLSLWRKLNAGVLVEHPRALLLLIADRTVADHFRRASSRETATDFASTNVTEVASGAAVTPHLAGLFAELEAAKDALSLAAETYRAVTNQHSVACAAAANAIRPDSIARAEARKAATGEARAAALNEFAAAGRAVALARAAWNANAGDLHGLVATPRKTVVGAGGGQ
ncbi:sigma factor [Kitasatospora sp. GP82]|uniref:RNA polymerase sigma factor n=1 Tax=Kitasatospora sp. GP82 TaxID=3035089 RepID=UPI0024769610|nr:sigma factor [Kitasatospora sp. GP82]MDH6125958.1 DNA-directed RNA polymerase specialized sigma24 family protein [Kitasatospora sp. GP82]